MSRAAVMAALLAPMLGAIALTRIAQTPATTAIVHAKLYTMESAQPLEDATIVVRGGVVLSVGAALAPPAGARVVDAGGRIVARSLDELQTIGTRN